MTTQTTEPVTVPQAVTDALTALEGVYREAYDLRQRGMRYEEHRRIFLAAEAPRLIQDYKRKVQKASYQVDIAIQETRLSLDARQQTALREDAASDAAGRYLAVLPALSTIVPHQSADQVADRLEQALDAGMRGDARALAELTRIHVKQQTPRLVALLRRADRETLAPALVQVRDESDALEGIAARWSYARVPSKLEGRLSDIIVQGEAPERTGFSPAFVLGQSRAFNARYTVR